MMRDEKGDRKREIERKERGVTLTSGLHLRVAPVSAKPPYKTVGWMVDQM